ncbi:cysteine peptidase family C39 domain-containing protein [Prochlorococcus marinus]|uniref:cysteine peptidase family C39 domain-containing protein n=1 Tax=Prochlorococcus TaxID=1218 RepID=UPI0007BB8318|nr:cysteine peptidase family C39 domain-containing protein [Prochlorococcus marinus]KZR77524.1 Toxin RTX-I translocation ATP-binding protein [Prochlorococcus marinus str. MIT 1323]
MNKTNKLRIVYQAEEAECGLACLSMLLLFHRSPYKLNLIRQVYGSTRGGINLSDLMRFSSSLGLRLVPENTELISEIPSENLPCITLWHESHFVVLSERTNNTVTVYDPAFGVTSMPLEEAQSNFSSVYLKSRVIPSVLKKHALDSTGDANVPRILSLNDIGPYFLIIALSLVIVSSFFAVGNAQVQDVFFNWIVEMQIKQWSTPLGYVQIITGLLASLSLFALALYVAKKYTDLSLKWNSRIFQRMLYLPEEYFLSRRSGDTISRFNYADNILRSSQSSLVKLVVAFVNLGILFFILFLTNLVLVILTLFAAVFAIGIAIAINPRQRSKQQQVQECTALTERYTYDLITDFDQIRLEGREQYYLKSISNAECNRISLSNDLSFNFVREEFFLSVLDNTSSALLLIAAGVVIMSGQMTLGQYAAIDVLVSMSLSPLMNLSNVIRTLQETNVSIQRLSDITDQPVDKRFLLKSDSSLVIDPQQLVLNLSDVVYSYSVYSPKILNRLSLSLSTEQFPVLIKGESGSGKSTLARVVSGRTLASSGSVQLYGHEVSGISFTDLNMLVGLVDGVPYIRESSVFDNLRIGSDASVDVILEIINTLGISDLPLFSVSNRRLSSSFRDLSGGELVLVQLIRVLARSPKLIILDESASPISERYRSLVISGAMRYCPNLILISHEVPNQIEFKTFLDFSKGQIQLSSIT